MRSITIHNLDDGLDALIRKEAGSWGLSLNKTIKRLLERSLGITHKYRPKNDFSKFFGVWNKKEADEFDKTIQEEFETVDKEDWK